MTTPSILTQEEKANIFLLFSKGATKAAIAREYDVSPRTIGRIITAFENRTEPEIVDDTPKYKYEYIITNQLIVLTRASSEKSDVVTVTKDDPRYDDIKSLVNDAIEKKDNSILSNAFLEASIEAKIESASFGNVRVNPGEGTIEYVYSGSGEVLKFSPRLTKRLLSIFEGGFENNPEFDGLLKFIEKLAFNPDPDMIERLYDFIAPNNIDITPEGNVRCYKKVRDDFKDIYTGNIDNSPGKTVRVKRDYVEKDQYQTCKQGLHVCSWSYLPSYGSEAGNVVMEVDVDPADFVSIPVDYHDAKARVCQYKVIKEVTDTAPWESDYSERFDNTSDSLKDDDDDFDE